VERTLSDFARAASSLEARVRAACGLARAVAALHRRGLVHGALSPETVLVTGEGDAVVLAPPVPAPSPLALAGWAAPEVIRGEAPTRCSDAFAAGALARLALAGRGPWEAEDPLERSRRVLFEEPRRARLDEPALPAEVEDVLARLLDRRPRRRARLEDLLRALEADAGVAPVARAAPPSAPVPVAAPSRPRSPFPYPVIAAAAVAALLLAALLLRGGSGATLSREVAAALARGDLAAARARLDAPPRGTDRALLEKLRGDVACARDAPGECLRRYRRALAARPELREDEALRRNVRALLSRKEGCETRRSAALLVGELRDPGALPALEAARRAGGLLAFLCTGDAIDRAIASTRAAARSGGRAPGERARGL
jgi:hypothetical protein